MSYDHVMPADHDRMLRQGLGMQPDVEFPKEILDRYWSFKRCCDRITCRVQANDLARIIDECGHGKPTEKEASPPSVVELSNKKSIKYGDPVTVVWRGKEKPGTFQGAGDGKKVLVTIEGSDMIREVPSSSVTYTARELATA